MARLTSIVWFFFAQGALSGCGHAAPPPSAEPAPSAPSPASSEAPSAPAASASSEAEPAPSGPAAKLLELKPSNESTPYMRMKIMFSNPTSAPCTFRAYTLVWSGGKKRVEGKNFVLPPGAHRQRTLRVDDNDGKLQSLSPKTAWIDLETDCSGK